MIALFCAFLEGLAFFAINCIFTEFTQKPKNHYFSIPSFAEFIKSLKKASVQPIDIVYNKRPESLIYIQLLSLYMVVHNLIWTPFLIV